VHGFERGDKIATLYGYSFPWKHAFQGVFLRIVRNEWVPYGYDLSEEKMEAVMTFVTDLVENYHPEGDKSGFNTL